MLTKEEFVKRLKIEKIYIGQYQIELDTITDAGGVLGCVQDQGKWKVFETHERGGHYILEEFDYENDAFDYFYKIIKIIEKRYKY